MGYQSKVFHYEDCRLSMSLGNDKLGNIANFNLPPTNNPEYLGTCSQTCEQCYALRFFLRHTNTRKAYMGNAMFLKKHMRVAKLFLIDYIQKREFPMFRIHCSGEFFSREYITFWIDIIEKCKKTQFLAYSKELDILELNISKYIPNFSVMASIMPDSTTKYIDKVTNLENPIYFTDYSKPPFPHFECKGTCETCKTCFYAKTKTVVFNYMH